MCVFLCEYWCYSCCCCCCLYFFRITSVLCANHTNISNKIMCSMIVVRRIRTISLEFVFEFVCRKQHFALQHQNHTNIFGIHKGLSTYLSSPKIYGIHLFYRKFWCVEQTWAHVANGNFSSLSHIHFMLFYLFRPIEYHPF